MSSRIRAAVNHRGQCANQITAVAVGRPEKRKDEDNDKSHSRRRLNAPIDPSPCNAVGIRLSDCWERGIPASNATKGRPRYRRQHGNRPQGYGAVGRDGYFVYAGARKDADLKELGKIKNVQAVRLDVTKQADIDAAVTTIKEAGRVSTA